MAQISEGDRPSARGQVTIKSKLLTAEVQNAARLAAAKAGMSLGDWVSRTINEAALAELGRPVQKPQVPARVEDVAADLRELVERRIGGLEERIAGTLEAKLAGTLEAIRQAVAAPAPAPAPDPVAQPAVERAASERDLRRMRVALRRRAA